MTILSVNGLDYHVQEAGEGEPLLLLHGFMGSTHSWANQRSIFAEQHHVIAVDLPGHGLTESPDMPARHNIAQVAADLVAILDQLGLAKVHLLGYSMGGRVALYFAVHYPERLHSLILESASPGLASAAEREARIRSDEALAQKIEREGLASFVDYWENLPLFASQKRLSAEPRAAIRNGRLQNNPAGLTGSLRGLGTGSQPSLWDKLDRLPVPTLLIAGALDSKYVDIGQRMAKQIPAAHLEIVEEAGHTIHLEQPAHFVQLVLAHLDRYADHQDIRKDNEVVR